MSTQPNNDTLHAQSLAGGSLTGGMQARKIEKRTKRTLRAPCHASFGFKSHNHRCMSMMVMKSFSIVLDMVVSETLAWTNIRQKTLV
jgi:hypothetical protein